MNLKERNENLRNFFNRKIDTYDDVHQKFMKTKEQITENLNSDTQKVLDLGAGTGLELIALFNRFPNADVTAIDITENMLKELKQRPFADKVNTIWGDFFNIEFGTNYDAVISTAALHHFLPDDKKKLYQKIYAALKEGGQFINSDKCAASIEEEQHIIDEYYKYKDLKDHYDTQLSSETEIALLTEVGFKNIEILETGTDCYKLFKATK